MENVQHYVSVLFIIIVSSERREKWKNHESRVLRTTTGRRNGFTEKQDMATKRMEKPLAHTILFKRNTYYYNNNIIIYNII